MKIDETLVRHVAKLARLRLREGEAERYAAQLGRMVEYVEQLSALDVSGLEATAHVLEAPTPFREDEPRPSLPQEEALANAPDREDPFFKVPRVIE